MFTMHFDVEFSSVSMASRPPTIAKITMFWSSCRDHDVTMQVRESSQPITHCKAWQPRVGDAVDKLTASCHVDTMAAISWNYVSKNIEITSEWKPSVHNRINNLSMKVYRYLVGKILLEIRHHFFSWSWCHDAGARELSANHTLQSMTTTCWWRHWQADGLLSCWYNGGHIVKLCQQKRRNYVRMGAISSQL